jgi:phosphoglycolate phosphatase
MPVHPRPAAVLFDLDGTLADSFEGLERSLNRTLRGCGLPTHSLDWVRTSVGHGLSAVIRRAAPPGASDAERRRLAAAFIADYEATFIPETPPLPGVAGVLAHVARGTGGRVGVVSNKLERLCRAWLAHWGLGSLVARVAGPDSFGVAKPNPGAILPVLAGFGVLPQDALLVGDMAVDAATGLAAGVPVIGVRQPWVCQEHLRRAGMAAVLFDLRDLPGWLAGNGTGWGGRYASFR